MAALTISNTADLAAVTQEARGQRGLTQADLATRAKLSRSAVNTIERGRGGDATLSTVNAILKQTGRVLLAAECPRFQTLVDFDPNLVSDGLTGFGPNHKTAIYEAEEMIGPEVIAHTLLRERLRLSMTKVRVMYDGVTVDGDPWTVWRTRQLIDRYRDATKRASSGRVPQLGALTPAGWVDAPDDGQPIPVRAIDFACRMLRAGASETDALYFTNPFLVFHGYPWLYPYGNTQDQDDALARLSMTGNANPYIKTLIESLYARKAIWRASH